MLLLDLKAIVTWEVDGTGLTTGVPCSMYLLSGVIWSDALLMDEVLLKAALSDFSLKVACVAVKQYIDTTFSRLLLDISDALTKVQYRPKEGAEEYTLQSALDTSKKAVIEGSINVLQVRHDKADNHYSLLCKKSNKASCSSYCRWFRCLNTYIGHPRPCDRSKWICYSCSYKTVMETVVGSFK